MHIPTRRNNLSLSIFSVRKLLKILLVRPVMRLILRRAGQGGSSSRGDFSILAKFEIEKKDN